MENRSGVGMKDRYVLYTLHFSLFLLVVNGQISKNLRLCQNMFFIPVHDDWFICSISASPIEYSLEWIGTIIQICYHIDHFLVVF